jgi:hypothetical protein
MLQNLPEKEQWLKEPQQSSIWHGRGTRATSSQLESNGNGIWMNSQETKNTESSAHSVTQSEKADYILRKSGLINQNKLEPPWTMYHRPSSWLADLTPDLTETVKLHSFYNANCGDINQLTFPKRNK